MMSQHWNFYLAIEGDLEKVTRYIEFSEENMDTYSIELSHILLSSCSEIDVLLKSICKLLVTPRKAENIDNYRQIIQKYLPNLIEEEVSIGRYRLLFKPFIIWKDGSQTNPEWWKGYNNVKHHRDTHFKQANLKNAIYAVGALSIVVLYYYKVLIEREIGGPKHFRDITSRLYPRPMFVYINADYYHRYLTD